MPRRSIPRWLRTALVFLASLQAARAGSVEAQSLTGHRVEQATATSAPRDPIPLLQEPIPVAVVIVDLGRRGSLLSDHLSWRGCRPGYQTSWAGRRCSPGLGRPVALVQGGYVATGFAPTGSVLPVPRYGERVERVLRALLCRWTDPAR